MKIKNPRYIFLGVIVLSAVVLAFVSFNMYNKTHEDLEDIQPAFKLEPAELFASFETNETEANKQYLGKILEVTGKISSIENLSDDKVNVVLQVAEDAFGGISCSFISVNADHLALLEKGKTLTIRGECTGFLMDVNLVRCVIITL